MHAVILSSNRTIQSTFYIAAILFFVVIGLVLLYVQPFPVLHDYPEWMYQGYVVFSLLGETGSFSETYELVPVPVPNAISQAAIAILNSIVSPVMAGKIWLAFYLVLAASVAAIATSSRIHSGAMYLIFTVAIIFGPGFWNGYINFQFGLLFFALFASLHRPSLVWVFVFSLLIYFSHASVFAGFVCYVIASAVFAHRRTAVAVALLPSITLLIWYSITKLIAEGGHNEGVGSVVQWVQYKLYTLAKQGPFHNFIQSDGESLLAGFHGLYMAGFAINFLAAILIGLWLLLCGWKIIRRKDIVYSRVVGANAAVVATIFVLLSGWLLAGKNSFGVVNLGERFLIVALVLLIVQVRCPAWITYVWASLCALTGIVTLGSLLVLSGSSGEYSVDRSADATELENYVDDIYKNSRHKYFNHRLLIYANLGQYLTAPNNFSNLPSIDHQSSIVRIRQSDADNE